MIVYVDVLLALNIYVNFFLIKATAKLTSEKIKTSRLILSSLIGSLYSLLIFLPPINPFILTLIKLSGAFLIVLISFGFGKIFTYIKNTFVFFAVNFIFSGIATAFIELSRTDFFIQNNMSLYADFSLAMLIISTIVAYFVISFFRYLFDRKSVVSDSFSVIISFAEKTFSLKGIADSGNRLVDNFTGTPVIVCDCEKIGLTEEYTVPFTDKKFKGLRFLTCTTVNKSGIIPAFTPESVIIKNETTGEMKSVDAMIGIAGKQENDCEAIFNPTILT